MNELFHLFEKLITYLRYKFWPAFCSWDIVF